jgi:hypothetical protein
VVDKAEEAINASIANIAIANETIAIDLTSAALFSLMKYFAIFLKDMMNFGIFCDRNNQLGLIDDVVLAKGHDERNELVGAKGCDKLNELVVAKSRDELDELIVVKGCDELNEPVVTKGLDELDELMVAKCHPLIRSISFWWPTRQLMSLVSLWWVTRPLMSLMRLWWHSTIILQAVCVPSKPNKQMNLTINWELPSLKLIMVLCCNVGASANMDG